MRYLTIKYLYDGILDYIVIVMSDVFDIKSAKIRYKCLRCGHVSTAEKISARRDFMCPNCMFNILEKVRGEVVRETEAV